MSIISVALLGGGSSAEKEISLKSSTYMLKKIREAGFDPVFFDPADESFSIENLKKFDIIYPILHGTRGEDGVIQGVLEYLNIPYVGCGILASAITMNKEITKEIWHYLEINHAKGFIASSNIENNLKKIKDIGYPVFIKPVSEGSSIGGMILRSEDEARKTLPSYLQQFPESLIEEFLNGREMTVGIIQDKTSPYILPVVEIQPKSEYYSFETKYTKGMFDLVLPALIDQTILEKIHCDLTKMFHHFQLQDCVRIDFILTEKGPVYLEINSSPGMTATSTIPMMLKHENIAITDFITNTIYNTLERFSCKKNIKHLHA